MPDRDSVFVNYRHGDERLAAELITQMLTREFGSEAIFFDVDIPPGINFENAIRDYLDRSRFMVVVIGPRWEALLQSHSDDDEDYALQEIEYGLHTDGLTVLPVRVSGAPVPSSNILPDRIKELSKINFAPIRSDTFQTDVQSFLIADIGKVLSPRERKIETMVVKVKFPILGGLVNPKKIRSEIEKQAKDGWTHTGQQTNWSGFGRATEELYFQREVDVD